MSSPDCSRDLLGKKRKEIKKCIDSRNGLLKMYFTKVRNSSRKQGMKGISEGLGKVLLQLDDIRKHQSPGILTYRDTMFGNDCVRNKSLNCLACFHAGHFV